MIDTRAVILAAVSVLASSACNATYGQFGVYISDPIPAHANAARDTGDDFGNQIASVARGHWMSMARSNEPGPKNEFGDDFDILASRSVDGGFVWSDLWPINLDARTDTGRDRGPQYAHDGQGNWIVVWYRGDIEQSGLGDQDVFYATSTDGTLTWSEPVDLLGDSFTDGGDDDHPQVATDGKGHWMIVWSSKRDLEGSIGTDSDVLFVRTDQTFGQWTVPSPVNTNAATDSGDDRIVQVSTNGIGTWIVAWHSNDTLGGRIGRDRDILYARSVDNGQTWSDPYPINTNADRDSGQDTFVQIANDGGTNWIAVWDSTENLGGQIGSDKDILFATSSDDGLTWSNPRPLNTNANIDQGDDETPQIKSDGRGNWVVTWSSTDSLGGRIGNDLDILIARSTNNGATWTDPAPANTYADRDGGAADHYPHLATDGYGNWLVQWRWAVDGGYGPDWDVFVAHFFLPAAPTPIVHVDASAAPGGDGASWDTAFVDLQQALELARVGGFVQEIWVAAGAYRADRGTGDRTATFELVDGVGVYGGFAGDETAREQRDPQANPTILTGDIGARGVLEDNTYNIVTCRRVGASTVLDGFVIEKGLGDGGLNHDRGAGLFIQYGSPTINGCSFIDHAAFGMGGEQATGDGAAIFNLQGSPIVTNCYFARNRARRRGGAVFNAAGRAVFLDCVFEDNSIVGGALGDAGGGAVFNFRGSPTYRRCYFERNSGGDGGSFYNHYADTVMTNCDFYKNDGRYGAAVYNYLCNPILVNCTFRQNDRQGRFLTRDAGAVFNRDSRPVLVNCLMAENYSWRGGAMYNIHSAPSMINCTIVNNVALDNSATMHNLNSRPVLHNCILWNPQSGQLPEISDLFGSVTTIRYSDVRGGWPGQGNLNVDPRVMLVNGHYPLQPDSPLIDAGNNNAVPPNVVVDLLRNPRFIDDPNVPDRGNGSAPVVDIGAYERVP